MYFVDFQHHYNIANFSALGLLRIEIRYNTSYLVHIKLAGGNVDLSQNKVSILCDFRYFDRFFFIIGDLSALGPFRVAKRWYTNY